MKKSWEWKSKNKSPGFLDWNRQEKYSLLESRKYTTDKDTRGDFIRIYHPGNNFLQIQNLKKRKNYEVSLDASSQIRFQMRKENLVSYADSTLTS